MIRQRGGTTRGDDQDARDGSSVEEIGRLLREAREERGLDLLAVHDRLSRPITQIEALEAGDLTELPDQTLALSTLRRYAAFLGLDGDALALRMIDAWSDTPAPARVPVGAGAVTSVVTAVTSGPDHLRAFTQTGEVPRVGAGSAAGGSGAYGYDMAPGPPTGTFPVVPRQELRHSKRAVARARRRLRAPTWLKVVTWLAAVLMAAVLVGFGLQQWRPQLLARAHILRVAAPGTSNGGGGPAAGHQSQQPARVVLTSFTAQSATYAVASRHFAVNIATSGQCWVQVTSSSSPTPLVSGVQPAGKLLSFPADGTMTVQVGASAVIVGITIDRKGAFLNSPQATPFTYTFAPAGS